MLASSTFYWMDQGADPGKPVTMDVPCSRLGIETTIIGERALHIAARSQKVGIVSLMLNRPRVDVNATDCRGCTPLMSACESSGLCVEVVRLLLQAGADPGLPEKQGHIPLHMAARRGHVDLVGMLYFSEPATLNCCAAQGQTPLFLACAGGHESVVSRLLSLGVMGPQGPHDSNKCPLTMAASRGFVGVVGVMMNKRGIRAVGGKMALVNEGNVQCRYIPPGESPRTAAHGGWSGEAVEVVQHESHGPVLASLLRCSLLSR